MTTTGIEGEQTEARETVLPTKSTTEGSRCVPGAWQTIDSAPKDGTDVLLFCHYDAGGPESWLRVTVGHWLCDPGGVTEYRDADGRWTGQREDEGFEGWLSWDGGFSEETMMPTHWMPLPPPPGAPA